MAARQGIAPRQVDVERLQDRPKCKTITFIKMGKNYVMRKSCSLSLGKKGNPSYNSSMGSHSKIIGEDHPLRRSRE
jgi:hypothetical protein